MEEYNTWTNYQTIRENEKESLVILFPFFFGGPIRRHFVFFTSKTTWPALKPFDWLERYPAARSQRYRDVWWNNKKCEKHGPCKQGTFLSNLNFFFFVKKTGGRRSRWLKWQERNTKKGNALLKSVLVSAAFLLFSFPSFLPIFSPPLTTTKQLNSCR